MYNKHTSLYEYKAIITVQTKNFRAQQKTHAAKFKEYGFLTPIKDDIYKTGNPNEKYLKNIQTEHAAKLR